MGSGQWAVHIMLGGLGGLGIWKYSTPPGLTYPSLFLLCIP